MNKPSIGRIVLYALTEDEARDINRRRNDAYSADLRERRPGLIAHIGNPVEEGQIVAMTITGTYEDEYMTGTVNGQCTLDGNDALWVTSISQGDGPGTWQWPERT